MEKRPAPFGKLVWTPPGVRSVTAARPKSSLASSATGTRLPSQATRSGGGKENMMRGGSSGMHSQRSARRAAALSPTASLNVPPSSMRSSPARTSPRGSSAPRARTAVPVVKVNSPRAALRAETSAVTFVPARTSKRSASTATRCGGRPVYAGNSRSSSTEAIRAPDATETRRGSLAKGPSRRVRIVSSARSASSPTKRAPPVRRSGRVRAWAPRASRRTSS